MLGHLFRQCADGVPAIRPRQVTATMLISELGRVVKLPETHPKGIALISFKRRGRVKEAKI